MSNFISRRSFLKAAGVGVAALGLAACGGSSSSSTAGSTPASSAAGAAASGKPYDGVVLHYAATDTEATGKEMQDIVKMVKEKTGIQIDFTIIPKAEPGEVDKRLVSLQAGDELDIVYAGVIEALSGAPFDVRFLSFEDIRNDPHVLDDVDVLLNIGDGDTAHTGGIVWEDATISSAIRGFVRRGGGLIGVGEPGGHQYQGHYLQLAGILGVEKETGFTLNYDKYNWEEHRDHFILADCPAHDVDFGEGKKSIFALEDTEILIQREKEVQMAVHEYGKGRGVYLSGLPYSFANSRVLHRAILWAAHDENSLHHWFSSNYNVELHAYVQNGKYCVVNNTYEPQDTIVYTGDGSSFALHLDANEIRWYKIEA